MGQTLLYHVVMGTGLALAIDKNAPHAGGQLILAYPNSADADQQWAFVFYPATQASILYNIGRNLFAAPAQITKGAPVVLFPLVTQYSGANTWQILSAKSAAIRPQQDTGLNMNALGSSWPPETKIGIWDWGGGSPNEVWTSTLL
jgi:hypothetical protein